MSTYRASRAVDPYDNPDWRTDTYSYLRTLDDDSIAFEFLRRNLDYWRFYRDVMAYPREPMRWPAENATMLFAFPDDKEKTTLDGFGIRRLCDPRRAVHYTNNPWKTSSSLCARYVDAIRRADANNHFEYIFRNPRPLTMRVDLLIDGPIESQIDFVRWALKRAQRACWINHKEAPRIHRDQFPRYLRLLDARSDRASYREIAKCLFPRQGDATDRVKKQYKAASHLRDGGYKDLLIWGRVSIPESLPKELHERSPII
jgi:hypothetical protein